MKYCKLYWWAIVLDLTTIALAVLNLCNVVTSPTWVILLPWCSRLILQSIIFITTLKGIAYEEKKSEN